MESLKLPLWDLCVDVPLKNAFIIADEMQNSSPSQMLMLLTRIGDQSKMVITGDLRQSDLFLGAKKSYGGMVGSNGLKDFIHKLRTYSHTNIVDEIRLVEMTADDVERSQVVRRILEIDQGSTRNVNILDADKKNETRPYDVL